MLGNIRDITVVIAVSLLMLVGMLVFFMTTLDSSELTEEAFVASNQDFIGCAESYQQTQKLYETYTDQAILSMEVLELAEMRQELELETGCMTDYVSSNEQQLSTYAEHLYEYLTAKYPNQEFGLLDTIYTAPAKYYAYLGEPQSYLFFAMNAEQTVMLGYVYTPQVDGYNIEELWTVDEASDLEQVQDYTQNLLVKYYEKVI
ncbi:hypothetical protein R2F61_06395 [Mollicutes bacterium LVI A0078]|nr:hypothetical protein RZE84_06400 [Mollicutes bacterium LVI A0075]WOO90360.1 hypothetical protein R2F61_06395 [Mollicutes bacterium LVI A0078]